MSEDARLVTIERRESVAWMWLDRADRLNAMNQALFESLIAASDELRAADDLRAVVLAARGRHFSVGLDLQEAGQDFQAIFGPSAGGARVAMLSRIERLQQAAAVPLTIPCPVIAAVHGACVGGGLDLVSACDIRLCSQDAYFSLKEASIGVVADLGSLQRLPRIIGEGFTRELAYTAREVDAAEALEMRLVNRVAEDRDSLYQQAQDLAVRIAANAPLAVRGSKQVLNRRLEDEDRRSLDYAAAYNMTMLPCEDLLEAVTAFMEKRKPQFKGK